LDMTICIPTNTDLISMREHQLVESNKKDLRKKGTGLYSCLFSLFDILLACSFAKSSSLNLISSHE
jgi:hypothetical protein